MDFYRIVQRETKTGIEISPDFLVQPSKDLMVRGGSFYAVWNEAAGLWSTDEYDVQRLVDADLYEYSDRTLSAHVKTLGSFNSGKWREFRSYLGNVADTYHVLDNTLTFADTPPRKTDYSSKRLSYSPKAGSIAAYDEMMSVLYKKEEREKLEWAIGSILAGDSKKIQKFLVLYGEAGTGKSTFLDILAGMFCGYCATFDAKALTGTSNQFATESLTANPLVGIQHDGDLSKIEDNTLLNTIVSHEPVRINEKYKSQYTATINAMLFIGTNLSVRITDAKSGLIRRLIDVHPTGDTIPPEQYEALKYQIQFETAAIAQHCLEVYRRLGMNKYARYRPTDMITRTDIFYNFLIANYEIFQQQDGTTLKQAWGLYKEFCNDGGYEWKLNLHKFRDELRNYFKDFNERGRIDDRQVWNLYKGFRSDRLGIQPVDMVRMPVSLVLEEENSLLDDLLADCPAQYANDDGKPSRKWARVTSKIADLDTSKLHYVQPGLNHIVIDFDIRGDDGEKNLQKNLEAAAKWPATYAEFSKSGAGIHLHYIWDGDPLELDPNFEKGIEVKVFNGDASLRRIRLKSNNIPIATISSGLPLKERKVLDQEAMRSERVIRSMILRNLQKEFHPGTKPSIDFIWKILEDAYNSSVPYDVSDLRQRVLVFANGSTNQAQYCVRTVMSMKFTSDVRAEPVPVKVQPPMVFYDVEVYPNLFVVCWKERGKDKSVVRMINPSAFEIDELMKFRLVGFNNRKYDNHILYAASMGYSVEKLFDLSQRIINGENNSAMFQDAYNISHADIYDFSIVKQGLKRFQIELGLNHVELGLPWDQPVTEEDWEKVADYCANDVVTTEQVFEARLQDYVARQILASLANSVENDTTQRLTSRIVFGDERRPQEQFKYTDLAGLFPGYTYDPFRSPKSSYRGEDPGEGGYVYAEPGVYKDVAVLDVASMHPTSIELLEVFGPYTRRFAELKAARLAIKRRQYEKARGMLDGALAPYLESEENAKALSDALKIAINIVYGLTSASFPNPFRDPNNKDNIVAKRGALFMIDLKHAVQEQGFRVIHIKTDSIKIPGATPEIVSFIMEFGQKYGYEFEHEETYEKFCLVNDAVYIAKKADGHWTATGAQFAEPYVFKTLFSKEDVNLDDLAQTKTVAGGAALYLDFGDGDPHLVGRAGSFVPVHAGTGGGLLLRGKDGKFHAATGSKGYEWMETAVYQSVRDAHPDELEDNIDLSYYEELAKKARESISQFGNFEEFAS
jgi:hypothetical protein